MNNRFLGATVLAASCGSAACADAAEPAQPAAVTVYGAIDLGLASVSNVAGRVTGLQNGGFSSSRLGFRGAEDVVGGVVRRGGRRRQRRAGARTPRTPRAAPAG